MDGVEIVIAVIAAVFLAVTTAMAIFGTLGVLGAVRLVRCRECRHLVVSSAGEEPSCPYCHHSNLAHPIRFIHASVHLPHHDHRHLVR